jgi:hypothetical protein
MSDLSKYNQASLEAMQLIMDHMPPSEAAKVAHFMEQGLNLKLATLVGQSPDVTLSLVDDYGTEQLLYSLIGKAGETVQ